MAKVKDYFSHDYHARSDLRSIQKDWGLEGIGFYWCFVEILHENAGKVPESEISGIAYELHANEDMCSAVVHNYGFFTVNEGVISCDRVSRNLQKRQEVSDARRAAAESRWNPDEPEAPAIPDPEPPATETDWLPTTEDETNAYNVPREKRKEWLEERIERFEEEATKSGSDFDTHPIWKTGGYIRNLFDLFSARPFLKCGRNTFKRDDLESMLNWYMMSKYHLEKMEEIVIEVDEKVSGGEVKNKQNYLITALYQAMKMNGGGSA